MTFLSRSMIRRLAGFAFVALACTGLNATAMGQVADPRQAELPAEGLWNRPDAPGTALQLSRQGELIAVTLFDFEDGQPLWRVGAGQMQGSRLELELSRYADGSCINCSPSQAPRALTPPLRLVLRFESARRAWLKLGDGPERPLRAFAFGNMYADAALSEPLDAEFSPLPFPQLCGRWAFEPNPLNLGIAQFSRPRRDLGVRLVIAGTDEPSGLHMYALHCRDGSGAEPAHCDFLWTVGSPPASVGQVRPGDIEENRIRFVMAAGQVVYAYRLGGAPAECPEE